VIKSYTSNASRTNKRLVTVEDIVRMAEDATAKKRGVIRKRKLI
jgi:hypothetical protein